MTNNKTMEEKKQNPTNATVPGPIIIAPRIESLDITIVMGDQRSSYMNFNGGEACVEDPYGDGLGDEDFGEGDYDGEGTKDDGIPGAVDEIDRSGCPDCEFTDCVDHPMNRERQMSVRESVRQPQGGQQPKSMQQPKNTQQSKNMQQPRDAQQPKNTQQQVHGIKQPPKIIVTEGEAALEGMPELLKLIFRLLNDAGKNVEVKRYGQKGEYEQKDMNERKEDQSDE